MAYSYPNIPTQGSSSSTTFGNPNMVFDRPAQVISPYQQMLRDAYQRPSAPFGGNGGNAYQAVDNTRYNNEQPMHMAGSNNHVGGPNMTFRQTGMAPLNNNAFGQVSQGGNDFGRGLNQSTGVQASAMPAPTYFYQDIFGVPRSTHGNTQVIRNVNDFPADQVYTYQGNSLNNIDMSIDGFTNGGFATPAVNGNHGNVNPYHAPHEAQWDSATPESFIDPIAHGSTPSAVASSSPATSIAGSIPVPHPTGRRARARVDPGTFALPYLRAYKGYYLMMGRNAGLTFKQLSNRIRAERLSDTDSCNESTLRGIHRAYTKTKAQRPRVPTWNHTQFYILGEAVEDQARHLRAKAGVLDMTYVSSIKWKVVAKYIAMNGGDYEFGPSACKRKFIEKVEDGFLEPLQ